MKFRRRMLSIAAFGIVVAAAGWWLSRPDPVAVVLHEVARGTVEATLANTRAGEVEACQRTKLATITGGRIDYLGVKEGDRVLFTSYAGNEIKHEGTEYLLMSEDDILAVVG